MSNYHAWYIAGAGAIGLLFYNKLTQQANSEQQPRLIHRKFDQPYSHITITDINGKLHKQSVLWANSTSKIKKLIIATKSHQVIDCIEQLERLLSNDCDIVLLHNGLGPQQEAELRWPTFNFYFATTTEGAWKPSTNELIQAGLGVTQIGQSPRSEIDRTKIYELEQAGFQWHPNILEQLHLKVAINAAINPLTVLFECQNGKLTTDPSIRPLLEALCLETEHVFKAESIEHTSLIDLALNVAHKTGANYSSSYQDWKHQRKTELSHMNGYIQQLAKKHGLSTPTHDRVMADIFQKAII